MTCDTPELVAGLSQARLEFSGAASLFFESAKEVFLTWRITPSGDCYLSEGQLTDWGPFSLDLVHASTEGSWINLVGARLEQAIFYRDRHSGDELVAVQHAFVGPTRRTDLWIGVGRYGRVEEGDDMIIFLDQPPANLDELIPSTLVKT